MLKVWGRVMAELHAEVGLGLPKWHSRGGGGSNTLSKVLTSDDFAWHLFMRRSTHLGIG